MVLKWFFQVFALATVFAKEQLRFLARLVQQRSVEGSGVILAFDWRNGSRKNLHAYVSESRRTVLKQAFCFV